MERIRAMGGAGSGPEDGVGYRRAIVRLKEMVARFAGCKAAVDNAAVLVERCRFELVTGRLWLPEVTLAGGQSGDAELSRLCHLGLARRYRPVGEEAVRRLEHELGGDRGESV